MPERHTEEAGRSLGLRGQSQDRCPWGMRAERVKLTDIPDPQSVPLPTAHLPPGAFPLPPPGKLSSPPSSGQTCRAEDGEEDGDDQLSESRFPRH